MPDPRPPRDTTRAMREEADSLLFLAAGMTDRRGGASFIEEQEANGQREMVHSDVIPSHGYADEDLLALGFTLGDLVEGDPLFRQAGLPEGWKRQGSDHAMHSDIVDTLGRKRVGIFYKAAFYDRRADLSVTSLYSYLSGCLYDETEPVLDDVWATRSAVLAELANIRNDQAEHVKTWTTHGNAEYVAEYQQKIAKVDALTARIEATNGTEAGNA
jgi:hypothetical protein